MGKDTLDFGDLEASEIAEIRSDMAEHLAKLLKDRGFESGGQSDIEKLYPKLAEVVKAGATFEASAAAATAAAAARTRQLSADAIASADASRAENEASVERLRRQQEYRANSIGRGPIVPPIPPPVDNSGANVGRIA